MRHKVLTGLLLVFAFFGLQLTIPGSPAHAWSESLPQCGSFPYAWQSAIEADSRYTNNTSWVAFRRDWGGLPFNGGDALAVVWDTSVYGQLTFAGNGIDDTSDSFTFPSGVTLYQVSSLGFSDDVSYVYSPGWSSATMGDLNCVQDAHGVQYVSWAGSTFPDSVASNQGSLEYVAMGDSFSSCEGVAPFLYGTSTTSNVCHRSENAYSMLLDKDPLLDLNLTNFVACSGATTDSVMNGGSDTGNWNEGAQIDKLSSSTDVVTITIGGNDMKFKEFATACVIPIAHNCTNTSDEYVESWDILDNPSNPDYLPTHLEDTFADIAAGLTSGNTDARVLVIGYPYVVTEASWHGLSAYLNCGYLSEDEAIAAETIVKKLDTTIDTSVTAFDDPRFMYIDPNQTGSPFYDHDRCSNDPFFIDAQWPSQEYSFHPNQKGQEAYADLIKLALS